MYEEEQMERLGKMADREPIYLDYAATAPLSMAARQAMEPFLEEHFANASAIYQPARQQQRLIEDARKQIASGLITANASEIYFTSGGTESDNMALVGYALRHRDQGKRMIVSSIEHPAVLNAAAFLERLGFQITYLPVTAEGVVLPEYLEHSIDSDTLLVSVMYANHETGMIQPIKQLAEIAHAHAAVFHTDAVQAFAHIPINVTEEGIDMLSASGHKFGGPKGVGFLYMRDGITIEPLLHGGGQERGLRSGTLNACGIAGMAAACQEAMTILPEQQIRKAALRQRLLELIREQLPDIIINGADDLQGQLSGHLNIEIPGVQGEQLVLMMDQKGIYIASGSACTSAQPEPSHVLKAMGKTDRQSLSSVRITIGTETTSEQIETAGRQLTEIAKNLKQLCPYM